MPYPLSMMKTDFIFNTYIKNVTYNMTSNMTPVQNNIQSITNDFNSAWLDDYDEADTQPALLQHLPVDDCDGTCGDVDCGNDSSVYDGKSGKNCNIKGYLSEAKALHDADYSPHIVFAGMMTWYCDDITAEVLQKFITYGLDVNKPWPVYQNPKNEIITPLAYAIEHHRINLIQVLLDAGAKVDDPCGINSVINIALYGKQHEYSEENGEYDYSDWKTREIIIKMLDAKHAPKQILRWIRDDCCTTCIKESEYLRDYIASCEIVDN